jgi:hypothetical protein
MNKKSCVAVVLTLALAGAATCGWAAPPSLPDKKETTRALGTATAQGNVAAIKRLLRQGADPLAGYPSALQNSLYGKSEGDANSGKPLPAHAAVIVPLLVHHIVHVQKTPLTDIPVDLLGLAILDASDQWEKEASTAHGAARVRLLLRAGFSPAGLSERDAAAVLQAPDRALAGELLDRGMLRSTPGQARAGDARVLLTAVGWRRADVLPRLLQLGFDPNLRNDTDPSPVDAAIAQGAVDELKVLLAGGGRIDATARDAQGGVLDRAVGSGSAAMLRMVSGNVEPRLDQVCLPDTAVLVDTVLQAPDAYWRLLRKQGFATDDKACPGQAERVVLALAHEPAPVLAGWIGVNLRTRLPELGTIGAARADLGAVWPQLDELGRDDLRQLLVQSGWPRPPARAAAGDGALRSTLPGTYEADRNLLASRIVLRADGTFVYILRYVTEGEDAQGRWDVVDGRVVFTTPPSAYRKFLLAPGPAPHAPPPGTVSVTLALDERERAHVRLTLLGDAPVAASGRPEADGWLARLDGPVRHIVLTDADNPDGRPVVLAVPDDQALQRAFTIDVNPLPADSTELNVDMQWQDDRLVWQRDGITLRYKKTAGVDR